MSDGGGKMSNDPPDKLIDSNQTAVPHSTTFRPGSSKREFSSPCKSNENKIRKTQQDLIKMEAAEDMEDSTSDTIIPTDETNIEGGTAEGAVGGVLAGLDLVTQNGPRFVCFLIGEDHDLTKLSMIRIVGELERFISDFRSFFTRNKSVRVEVNSSLDLEALKKVKNICGHSIKVDTLTQQTRPALHTQSHTAVTSRTISWGKIFSNTLSNSTDDEILEQLQKQNQHILSVKRLFRGADKIPTRLLKIKFDTPVIPLKVFCLHDSYSVELYTPPPKKCIKCKEFGHWVEDCGNTWKCNICGKSHDESLDCKDNLHCVSCGEGHRNNDPHCQKYLKEKEIVEISYQKNVSFPQARTLLATGTRSFANIVRGSYDTQPNNISQPPASVIVDTTDTTNIQASKTQCNVKDMGTDTPPTDIELEIRQANIHTDRILVVGNVSKTELMQKFTDAMASLNGIIDTITAAQAYPNSMKQDLYTNMESFCHSWQTMIQHYIFT